MTHTIRVPKPPCPLPLISRPARKWLPRDRWGQKAEEARHAATSGEPDAFIAKIRGILFGREQ